MSELTKGEEEVLKAIVAIFKRSGGCYVYVEEVQEKLKLKLKNRRSLSGFIGSLAKKGYVNPFGPCDDIDLDLEVSNKTRELYDLPGKGGAANDKR